MKKRTIRIIGICILLLLLLAVGVLLYQFFAPGVHSFGPFFRCNIEEDVWLLELDHDNRKLLSAEQATVTVKGTGFLWSDSQDFDGSLSVSAYPVPDECGTMSIFWQRDAGWSVSTTMYGIHEDATPFIGPYSFQVTIAPYQNDTFCLYNVSSLDGEHSSMTGIAAETPEEALALFNEYNQAYAAQHDATWMPYS